MKAFKRLFSLLVLVAMCLIMVGCKKNEVEFKIGIVQYVSAGALDNAREGIEEALKKGGFEDGKNVKITVYNPQANQADLATMAEQAIQDNDLVFAIATPVALVLKAEAEKQGSDIPILFTAVTDPVASGIVSNATKPGGNISGTNDMNPVADQIALALELGITVQKIGIVFTSSESNSLIQANLADAKCRELGITLVQRQISSVNDLQGAVTDLVENEKVDVMYIPTDNIVADNMSTVATICNDNQVVTICGEEGLVGAGGIVTLGINYKDLGVLTGEMAVKVLKGEAKVGDLAVAGLTKFELVINTTKATEAGITIPQALLAKANRTI